jgi:hypothetical protein
MNKSGYWMTGLGLFLMGAVTGALAMGAWFFNQGNPMARMERLGPAGFVMDRLSHELNLTEAQRQQIAPIVKDMMERGDALRKPCIEAEEKLFEEEQSRVSALLTPEQAARHAEMIARMKAHQPQFDSPPGPGGPHGPGGPGWPFSPGPPPPPR